MGGIRQLVERVKRYFVLGISIPSVRVSALDIRILE